MNKFIKSRIQFEGIHNWSNCPLPEVDFLKFPHRHVFTIIATKEVTHLDNVNSALNLGSTSCEMIAEKLLLKFDLLECEVWEDMENCGGVKK